MEKGKETLTGRILHAVGTVLMAFGYWLTTKVEDSNGEGEKTRSGEGSGTKGDGEDETNRSGGVEGDGEAVEAP